MGLSAPRQLAWSSLVSGVSVIAFVLVERRVRTPLIDLALLRNKILVGVHGRDPARRRLPSTRSCTFSSLYFQDPSTLGMTHAGGRAWRRCPRRPGSMVTAPLITPFVDRVGAPGR